MKAKAITNNLFQLTYLRFVNCYLVREEDGFTLIDTAVSGKARSIMQTAQELGLPIARIVPTHAHVDHVGSLDALHEALPDVPVAMSARDTRFLAGDMSLDASEPKTKLRGGYTPCKTVPTILLNEGDRVGSLEVIATPGHTPGHVSFLDTRDRSLIVGDAFQTMAGVAVSGEFKLLFPFVAMATWNKEKALESARKLLALQPSLLTAGHGPAVSNPQAEMARAIHAIEASLAKEAKKESSVA